MKKYAGILDQPKDTLDFSVWTPDLKLRPDIRRIMLARIRGLITPSMIKQMFMDFEKDSTLL